jgi:tetratricopeptide (TPR) repeat protein
LARGSIRIFIAALAASLALLSGACGGGRLSGAREARFEAGNAAYERGAFEEAVSIYEEIRDDGAPSAALHYNLANALFKCGRLGEAILEYERALRLRPRDPDIRDNLEYLRTLTVDRITPESSPITALGITYLLDLTSPAQDALVFIVCWILAGIGTGVAIASRTERPRRTALYIAALIALPALLAGASLGVKSYVEVTRDYGIVLEPQVNVLSGAGEGNPALFTIHEGTKVRLRSRSGGWLQISLADGLTGWLPGETVEEI